jgi:hypothetical protein
VCHEATLPQHLLKSIETRAILGDEHRISSSLGRGFSHDTDANDRNSDRVPAAH